MSIKYVILGYLSWRPMTGYEIKEIIADSETLPWSGNNNQVYLALVQLHDDGWVAKSIKGQAGASSRHIYSITETGIRALRKWVGSESEPPHTEKPFLYQLMWADSLDADGMDKQLEAYLNDVGEKLFFLRVQADNKPDMPERTPRERYLWEMIYKNWIAQYEVELTWIRQLRQGLLEMQASHQWAQSRQKSH